MASKAFLMATMVAMAFTTTALAADYMVGDTAGWNLGVNYTAWAAGKDFRVGDKLMFMYNKDAHTVAKVNGSEFQNCAAPSNASNVLRSGSDTITLAIPGKKWYICSVADHCSKGMKLVINVSEAGAPAPSPWSWTGPGTPSTSAANQLVSPLKSCVWILAALVALRTFRAN